MRCPKCDYDMQPNTKICPRCGTNVNDSSLLLGQKPTVSFSPSSGAVGSSKGDIQGFIRGWAILMLILGIIGSIYFSVRFGYPKVTYYYSHSEREFIAKLFFPILIGGIMASIDHYLILAGIANLLEKANDIRYYVRNR